MAGGSPTASTCACRAMPRACARSAGPPAGSGSRPRARRSSSCGRSTPRTARWASSRGSWRRRTAGRGGRLPSAAGVVATGYDDGMVLLVRLDDGAEILRQESGRRAGHGACLERDGTRWLRHRRAARPASSISGETRRIGEHPCFLRCLPGQPCFEDRDNFRAFKLVVEA